MFKFNGRLVSQKSHQKKYEIQLFLLFLANIASEVAEKVFCEATVGSHDDAQSEIVRKLIDTPTFRLRFYPDVEIIEMLGALKNIVAMLAGFSEGLKAGFNTRAAVESLLEGKTIRIKSFSFL